MNEQSQVVFPNNGQSPGHRRATEPAGEPVMLEGMKILFDDKVGLYPVDLVAKPSRRRGGEGKSNGNTGRTRLAARG